MLLVSFHGTSTGINNIWGFPTSGSGQPVEGVLPASGVTLDELRGMAVYGGNLYVVNGGKSTSNVLIFQGPPQKGPLFTYLDTVIGAGQSIMHPFGIAFVTPASPAPALPTSCFISNQDSNVVAQVDLTAGTGSDVNGSFASVSNYLTTNYTGTFLDGTFAASQNGNLKGVPVIAPSVPEADGGLGVTFKTDKKGNPTNEPQNSVRDVAVANGILFVCDEVDSQVNMYNLDGGALIASGSVAAGPTHLAINDCGLWVSAGAGLYWSPLPASATGASLSFQTIAITVPAGNKVAGISFDDASSVYVIFQDGSGGTGTGSIVKCAVTQGTSGAAPTLTMPSGPPFASGLSDTPEFCLWVSDSNWPG